MTVAPSTVSVDVSVVSQSVTVSPTVNQVTISPTGLPGPKGDKGDPGDVQELYSMVSGEAVDSLRVVRRESDGLGYIVSSDTVGDAHTVIGVSTQTVTLGGTFNYVARGELQDANLSLVDGAVYVGVDGVLTQTPPTTGFVLKVGHAVNSDTLFVDVGVPVELA